MRSIENLSHLIDRIDINVKQAISLTEKSEKTIRNFCKKNEQSEHISRNGNLIKIKLRFLQENITIKNKDLYREIVDENDFESLFMEGSQLKKEENSSFNNEQIKLLKERIESLENQLKIKDNQISSLIHKQATF